MSVPFPSPQNIDEMMAIELSVSRFEQNAKNLSRGGAVKSRTCHNNTMKNGHKNCSPPIFKEGLATPS
jgi:hypothetical protein